LVFNHCGFVDTLSRNEQTILDCWVLAEAAAARLRRNVGIGYLSIFHAEELDGSYA